MRPLPGIHVAIALCALVPAQAQRYRFEILQYPGAPITTATDINNHGHVVGIVQGLGKNMGFVKEGPDFRSIDVPGAGPLNGSIATGINDAGVIVGTFTTEGSDFRSHGFILSDQTITSFDVPASSTTQLGGINNVGQIAGRYFPAPGLVIARGFVKEGESYAFFGFPDAQGPAGTSPYDVNDVGQIVGEVLTSTGFEGFLFQSNTFSIIKRPNGGSVELSAINNAGQLTGSFRDFNGGHGFVTVNGRFYQIDVPGVTAIAFGTQALGINDLGQVVGNVFLSGSPSVLGFVATPCSGPESDCITLNEIDRPPSPPVIHCPPDLIIDCAPEAAVPVSFSVTATSETGPAPTVVCSPPSGSSFPVGATTVSCTATDSRGSQVKCEFRVVRSALKFTGFLPPLGGSDETGGSFADPLRTVRLGGTIPIKFVATCGGGSVSDGISFLEVTRYSSEGAPGRRVRAKARGSQRDVFEFRNGQWQLNLDTRATGMGPGKWRLEATLPDGSQHSAWIAVRVAMKVDPTLPLIKGRVVNEAGQPVPGALVVLSGAAQLHTSSDNRLNLRLATLPSEAITP